MATVQEKIARILNATNFNIFIFKIKSTNHERKGKVSFIKIKNFIAARNCSENKKRNHTMGENTHNSHAQ